MPCKSGSKSHFWGFRLIIGHHFSFSQTKQNIQTKQSKQIYVFHRILKCISRQPTSISEVFETALIKIVVLRYKRKWGKKKKVEESFETWAACLTHFHPHCLPVSGCLPVSANVWPDVCQCLSVCQCLGFTVCHCLGVSNSPVFTLKLYRQHTEEDHIFHIWIVAIFDPFHFADFSALPQNIISYFPASFPFLFCVSARGESHSQTGSTNLMCTTLPLHKHTGETCFRHVEVSEYEGGRVPC